MPRLPRLNKPGYHCNNATGSELGVGRTALLTDSFDCFIAKGSFGMFPQVTFARGATLPSEKSRQIMWKCAVGGGCAITVQTMTNTLTTDVKSDDRADSGCCLMRGALILCGCRYLMWKARRRFERNCARSAPCDRCRHPLSLQTRDRSRRGWAPLVCG